MSNVLEHVPLREYGGVLLECQRILKDEGRIILSMPDLEKCINLEPQEVAQMVTYGGQTDKHDFHQCGFKFDWIKRDLNRLGFEGVSRMEPFVEDCSTHPGTMTVSGTKRASFKAPENPKVLVCLSYPRVGFTLNFANLVETAAKLQWDTNFYTGAFWDKDLTLNMKKAVAAGYDYVMTVDYDSVFSMQDAASLLDFMQSKPEFGAAFGVQMSRWSDRPLVHDKRKRYTDGYTEVDGGHFGLTMLRCDMLRKIPQPWLWGIPGPDGEWDSNGRLDSDMNFWARAREHGFRIAQVNTIVLGHMEICIKWPCDEGMMYQSINAYSADGKPKDAQLYDVYEESEDETGKTEVSKKCVHDFIWDTATTIKTCRLCGFREPISFDESEGSSGDHLLNGHSG